MKEAEEDLLKLPEYASRIFSTITLKLFIPIYPYNTGENNLLN